MTFKKKDWIPYKRKAKLIEINVKDYYDQTIDFFKLKKGKTRDAKRIFKKLKRDYDFELEDSKEKKKKEEFSKSKGKKVLEKDIEW